MADNDIFRPNASIRPTVDRGFQRAKPDLKTSGRRVQQGSVLLLMAIGISLVIVFLPPDIFEQRAEMAFWVVAGLLTVFGVLWISAIGVLGAAVAGSVLGVRGYRRDRFDAEVSGVFCADSGCGGGVSGVWYRLGLSARDRL
jgi:hypothetical protein